MYKARQLGTTAKGHSTGRDMNYGVALALAYAGDASRAQALTDDLAKKFPEDTVVQYNYVPTLRAKLAVSRSDPQQALDVLRVASLSLACRHIAFIIGRICTPFMCAEKPILLRIKARKQPPSSQKTSTIGALC